MEQVKIEEANAKEVKPFSVSRYIENHSTLITLLIAVIGILGPTGYIVGAIYHQVYLSTFGVPTGLFPISAQDAYVYAYLVGTAYINKAILTVFTLKALYITVAIFSGFVLFVYLVAKLARWMNATDVKETQTRSFFNKLFHKLHPKNNDFVVGVILVYEMFAWLGRASFAILILTLCWLSLLLGAYNQADELAKSSLNKYIENGCTYSEDSGLNDCIKILNSKGIIIVEGYLVASLERKVALFNENGSSIREVKPSEILVTPRI